MGAGKTTAVVAAVGILIATISFALYALINKGVGDLLAKFGIENLYYQYAIVIVGGIVLLTVIGFGGKATVKKILRL